MFDFQWFKIADKLIFNYHPGLLLCLASLLTVIYIFLLHNKKGKNAKIISRYDIDGAKTDATVQERTWRMTQPQEADGKMSVWTEADGSISTGEDAKTILIADDDSVAVFALSQRLKRMGFHVIHSPDAVHALMGAMKVKPDLIIMDVVMPSGNGLAVAEMMASDPEYIKIPIIIHSVLVDETTKERCKKLGAWYVEKSPKSWDEIKVMVDYLFAKAGSEGGGEKTSAAKAAISSKETTAQTSEKSVEGGAADPLDADENNKPPSTQALPLLGEPLVPVCGHARLLCIDGPDGELDLSESWLAALGVRIIKTHDLEEGFWTCFTEKPHAIVVQMPKGGAKLVEILNRFAVHPFTNKIPLIFINHKNEIPQTDLPESANFKVLNTPIHWKDFLSELERIIPIASRQDEDPLTKSASRSGDDIAVDNRVSHVPAGRSEASTEPPLQILCIDDDPTISQSIAIRMKPYGIAVKGALNGTAGYLQAIGELPGVIFLDMNMPNGDGHYVLAKLKEHQRTKDIPVIILTMETHQGVRRQMIGMGAEGFVSKPVRWKELFEELGRHVPLPSKTIDDYKLQKDLMVSV